MSQGWIKLHRKIMDSELYSFKEPFCKPMAWIDMLLLANHKDAVFFKNGKPVTVKRGQLAYSTRELAKRWNWSQNKVIRFLDFLSKTNTQNGSQVNMQKTNITTLITILNYNKYQIGEYTDEYTDIGTDGAQTETNKNDKNTTLVKKGGENEKKTS
jgi:hypothetical protein